MASLTQEKNSNFLSISRTAGFIYPPAIKSLYAMVRRMYDLCTVKFWPLARNLGSLIPEKRKRNEKNSRGYTTPLRPRKGHSFPTFTIFYQNTFSSRLVIPLPSPLGHLHRLSLSLAIRFTGCSIIPGRHMPVPFPSSSPTTLSSWANSCILTLHPSHRRYRTLGNLDA